jgi:hypothetical protein
MIQMLKHELSTSPPARRLPVTKGFTAREFRGDAHTIWSMTAIAAARLVERLPKYHPQHLRASLGVRCGMAMDEMRIISEPSAPTARRWPSAATGRRYRGLEHVADSSSQ